MSPVVEHLSSSQARRVALRAQGLAGARPGRPGPVTARALHAAVDRLGLLQIDSVNVLARAHLMPVFSRLGPYDTALLDAAAGRPPRRLVEAWAHQASFVPPETFRLLGWRQRDYVNEAWGVISEVPLQHASVVEEIRGLVTAGGPLTAREVQVWFEAEHPATRDDWGWNWTVAKRVLEFLFFTGEITSAGRTTAFERRYDLTERVLPPDVLARPEPSDEEAVRSLVEISARAHGVGSARAVADYFRIAQRRVRPALDALVEDGVLVPVRVDGWAGTEGYLHRDATLPRRASGAALLSPFDPLVFERRRLEEMFGLYYRIEIYVPEPKRTWGYYVLPFLLGETIPALVDLKADRQARVLRVAAAHRTGVPGAAGDDVVVPALTAELGVLAQWLGLDGIVVGAADGSARGDLAAALHAHLGHPGRSAVVDLRPGPHASPTMVGPGRAVGHTSRPDAARARGENTSGVMRASDPREGPAPR